MLRQVLFFIPFLTFAVSAPAQNLCSETLVNEIVAARAPSIAHETVPASISVNGESVAVGKRLGSGTSKVYQSADGRYAIKFYPKPKRRQADHEWWATRFYESQGLKIPKIIVPPFEIEHEGTTLTVVVKEYIEGLRKAEFENPEILAKLGLDPNELKTAIDALEVRVRALYVDRKFLNFLEAGHADFIKWDPRAYWVGEFKRDNILLTSTGLVLIDP